MNNNESRSKIGLIDMEIDVLVKVCIAVVCCLAMILTVLRGLHGPWFVIGAHLIRYSILLSYIVPSSMRANLDIAKIIYSLMIQSDEHIPNTAVRSTTIPEELGRISYLLSDKTGTLTRNEMVFKKLQVDGLGFGVDDFGKIRGIISRWNDPQVSRATLVPPRTTSGYPKKSEEASVYDAVWALALCHNVTPVYDTPSGKDPDSDESDPASKTVAQRTRELSFSSSDFGTVQKELKTSETSESPTVVYQAASPDEVALVQWTESVGLVLVSRSLSKIKLRTPQGQKLSYTILDTFPFTSDRKRMGIILRDDKTNEITYLMKGEYFGLKTVHCGQTIENLLRKGK